LLSNNRTQESKKTLESMAIRTCSP